MNIAIGCDQGGYAMKTELMEYLKSKKIPFVDVGSYSEGSVDYPVYAKAVCEKITSGECELGILVCGTGIGMSMAANTHPGVRATVCWEVRLAENARRFFNANVLCLPAGSVAPDKALEIIHKFVTTAYEGGERYERRIHHLANPNKYRIEDGKWILED